MKLGGEDGLKGTEIENKKSYSGFHKALPLLSVPDNTIDGPCTGHRR